MFGLPTLDIAIIILYFLMVIGIGVWSSRRIRNQEDYFLGGRKFGKLVQTFATFGQATSVNDSVSVSTTTFNNGASGIWSSLLLLFATPTYWLVAPWYRRLRILTLGDFFYERYGSRRLAMAYSLIGTLHMMLIIALGFSAMAKTVSAIIPKTATEFTASERAGYQQAVADQEALLGKSAQELKLLTLEDLQERDRLMASDIGADDIESRQRLELLGSRKQVKLISHVDAAVLVWLICFLVMIYAVFGGLEASFLTTTIQGLMIIVLSTLYLPFAWAKLNEIHGGSGVLDGMSHVHRLLPDSFFEIFGSPNTIDFTWFYIVAVSVMVILNVSVQPNQLTVGGAARDEYSARFGFVVGTLIKRSCTVLWGLFGLTAVALYGAYVQNSDLVWGVATRDLLGATGFGLVGLMIACLLAALMSTVDCLMLTASSLLTHNIYTVYAPGRDPAHYVRVGRFIGVGVLLGSAWLALQFTSIFEVIKFSWEINAALAPAFWLGMKWRRANRIGAWASIAAGVTLFLVLPVLIPAVAPSVRSSDYMVQMTSPAPVTRQYEASEYDVKVRQAEIAAWDAAGPERRSAQERPAPLSVGDTFEKHYPIPPKGIFWTQGVSVNKDGERRGAGMLNLELLFIDWLGFDLADNSYAFNETIRIIFRILLPFSILILVSLRTRPDDRDQLDRFFAKMRTPVIPESEVDASNAARPLDDSDDPDLSREVLLFPDSSWELYSWTRQDSIGFALACLAVIGILLAMTGLVSIGG